MRLPLRLVRTIVILTAVIWQFGTVSSAMHASDEALAHSDDAAPHAVIAHDGDVQTQGDEPAEGGEHDHPAHTACGPCHGHALDAAANVAAPLLENAAAPLYAQALGIRASAPNGLFRPPRV